jgi:hypothetical protein
MMNEKLIQNVWWSCSTRVKYRNFFSMLYTVNRKIKMVKRTEAQRVGCIDKATKEECLDGFNCNWGDKRKCFARNGVSRGRIYRSRDSDDFLTLNLKDGDSISADRRAEDFETPGAIPYRPKAQPVKASAPQVVKASSGKFLAPKRPQNMTSICATFEKDEGKCNEYAPLCKMKKTGCAYDPTAEITSKTKMPRVLFSKQYRSGSPERAGTKPFTPGYADLLSGDDEDAAPTSAKSAVYDFDSETSDSDQEQPTKQQSAPMNQFEALIYFDTPAHAARFAKKENIFVKDREAMSKFQDVKSLNAFVKKAKGQSGFIAENIIRA